MKDAQSPYRVTLTVQDKDDQPVALSEIVYEDPDDAMRAYGHCVKGWHEHHRNDRRDREALRAAAGLDKDKKTKE